MTYRIGFSVRTIVAAMVILVLAGDAAASSNVALNKDVTLVGSFFTGGWGGGTVVSEDTVVDGTFLPRGNQWDQGPVWWDSNDGGQRSIEIDLGGDYVIDSFIVQADDNDAYKLYYWDETTNGWVLAWDIPNYDAYGWGMQTRPNPADDTEKYTLSTPITTDALRLEGNMENGDRLFAVSEIQAFGEPAEQSIPEFPIGLGILLPFAGILAVVITLRRK